MKKLWTLVALLCLALVACESATDDATRGEEIVKDEVIATIDDLIAQQNGEFNDEIFLKTLLENSLVIDRFYGINDMGEWKLEWEFKPDPDHSIYRVHVLFSKETFTFNRIDQESKICNLEDIYVFDDYEYSYDPETNILTINCWYSANEIKVGETYEAEVVYFDGDIVVLDGYFACNDLSKGSMWRNIFKVDKESRDNILRIENYLDEPQDVDSEAIFAKIESGWMQVCSLLAWTRSESYGWISACVNFGSFRLKGDTIEIFARYLDGSANIQESYYVHSVVLDVDNDSFFVRCEDPGVSIQDNTFRAIYDDGKYVIWLRDITLDIVGKDVKKESYVFVCQYSDKE